MQEERKTRLQENKPATTEEPTDLPDGFAANRAGLPGTAFVLRQTMYRKAKQEPRQAQQPDQVSAKARG